MDETTRHGEAFDYYYSLGEDRTYVSVSGRFSVASRTVERWAKALNWKERVIQRDLEVNKRVEKKTTNAIVNTKADYRAEIAKNLDSLKTIRQQAEKLIADATAKIASGEIKINDVNELDRVTSTLKKLHDLDKDYVLLDLKLVGEDVPDRTDRNITLTLPKDLDIDDII